MTYLESIRIKTEAAIVEAAKQAALKAAEAEQAAKDAAASVFGNYLVTVQAEIESAASEGKSYKKIHVWSEVLDLPANVILCKMIIEWLEAKGFGHEQLAHLTISVTW